MHLPQEAHRGADADRHRAHTGHAELALQPAAERACQLGIEAHIGVSRGDALQIRWPCPQRRHHRHIDAVAGQQLGDLAHVVAAAEAEQRGAQQVDPRPTPLTAPASRIGLGRTRCRQLRFEQAAHQLIEGFRGAPVLFLGIGGQLQIHHRDAAEIHTGSEGTRLVLDQLGGAALAHQQRLRLEARHRIGDRALHQFSGVAAQIAGLKRGVGDRRALVAPLDHREQQIGVGVALGRMQHVMHPFHRGGDAHRAHVRGAFVGPESEFHRMQCLRRRRERSGGAGAGRTVQPDQRPDRCHGWG